MLSACEASCSKVALASPDACKRWSAEGSENRCADHAPFMDAYCSGACAAAKPKPSPPSAGAAAAEPFDPNQAHGGGGGEASDFVPATKFSEEPYTGNIEAFKQLVKEHPLVIVNFYAPWCF